MKSDELNARARIRAHERKLRVELVRLGYRPAQLERKGVLELKELHDRAVRHLMGAPLGRGAA